VTAPLLSTAAVAHEKGCAPLTVRRAIERGELRAVRIRTRSGSMWAVRPDDVRTWCPRPVGRPRKEGESRP